MRSRAVRICVTAAGAGLACAALPLLVLYLMVAANQWTLHPAVALAVFVAGAVVAVTTAIILANRESRKVSAYLIYLSAAAEQLGAGQTRPRMKPSNIEEIDLVYQEIQRAADRMAGRLSAERQFSADASHQLRTLQQEMGLNFNGYIVVDFASFVKSVDAIGGVPMYFEESLHDKYAGLNIEAGCRLLDGKQALALARARKQVGDGSDISRIGRQQELVMAVAQEVLSSNLLTDAPSLLKVVDAVSQSVNVSSSLGQLTTIAGLANSLRGVSAQNIHFATMPWDPAGSRVTVNPTADYIWWAINHDVPFEVYDENGFPRARKPEGYTSPAQGNSPSEASATPSAPGGSATEPAGEPNNHETATNTSSEAPEVSGSATPGQPASPSPSVPVCTRGNAIPAS